jgi:hypothetical protein
MFQKQLLVLFFFSIIRTKCLDGLEGESLTFALSRNQLYSLIQFDIHKLGQYLYSLINGTVSQIQVVATFLSEILLRQKARVAFVASAS